MTGLPFPDTANAYATLDSYHDAGEVTSLGGCASPVSCGCREGSAGRSPVAAGLPVSLGQLGGLGHAAFGHGADDLAGAPVVRAHDAARVDGLQGGPGRLVVTVCGDQGQGQVQAGRGGAARPRRPVDGRFEPGQDVPGVALGGRVAQPGQRGGRVGLGLGRVVPVVMLGPVGHRQRRHEHLDAPERGASLSGMASLAQARPSCAVAWRNALPGGGEVLTPLTWSR